MHHARPFRQVCVIERNQRVTRNRIERRKGGRDEESHLVVNERRTLTADFHHHRSIRFTERGSLGAKVVAEKKGDDLYIGGAKVIATDVMASNGVVHVVDGVVEGV